VGDSAVSPEPLARCLRKGDISRQS
jgi:hypothetical protein